MAQFTYVAVTKTGDRVKGSVDAPNEAEVRVILRSQQLRPVRIFKTGAMNLDIGKLASFSGSAVLTVVFVVAFVFTANRRLREAALVSLASPSIILGPKKSVFWN